MALFFADLVREACWGEGTGDLALGGALPGHRRFADAVPAGARFHYAIAGVTHPDEWENGEGEIVDGKLVRTPVSSSADGAAVDFSAGLKTVALTVLSDWFAERDGATGIDDVAGLGAALAGKAAAAHGHLIADSAGLQAALDGKAALAGAAFSGAISAPSLSLGNDLAIADGGTGASSAAAARANLGLGTLATQNAGGVAITGGSASGLSSLSVSGKLHIAGAEGAGSLVIDRAGSIVDRFRLFVGDGTGFVADDNYIQNPNTELHILCGPTGTTEIAAFSGSGVSITGDLAFSGAIRRGGSQLIGARRTGWGSPSGTAARAGFDTASVTTEGLAQRVKALIDDLAAHGLIGS